MYIPLYHSLIGIVFDSLEGNSLEYTLRLRHEVGEDNSWETRDSAPNFQPPGPRVTNKSVHVTRLYMYVCIVSTTNIHVYTCMPQT